MRNKITFLSMLLFTVFSFIAKAQPGSNDTSFDPGTGADNSVWSSAIQKDGKIIIGGTFTSYNGTPRNKIVRLNPDGTLDTTFNLGSGADGDVTTMVLQSDGKIIIGGTFSKYNGISRTRIARLNANGTLDGTFNPGTGADGTIWTISLQNDNKIVIGGIFSYYNGISRSCIARLNADGTLDGTFNPGTGADYFIWTSAIQSDGKIIIGGGFRTFNGTTKNRIARLNSNGSLDVTFDPNGIGPSSGVNESKDIATCSIQSDGKIIIGGSFTGYNQKQRNRIARLNTDGTLDETFNTGEGADYFITANAIQSDGKIIITGGFQNYNDIQRNRIARLNTDGSLDNTFNSQGVNNSHPTTISIQSDGKIIIGGHFINYDGTARNRVARVCVTDVSSASSTPTTCMNTAITDITLTTTAATGIGVATGLPAGITASWLAGTITISGTPTESGIFNYSIPIIGCGTVNATGKITVNALPNVATTVNTNTIEATQSGATYQWLDCNNTFAIIPGATSQSYTASKDGNYAVRITQGICSNISTCVQIGNLGIETIENTKGIFIYPNPVTDELNVEIKANQDKTDFEIINSIGQVIFKGNFIGKMTIKTTEFSPGIYIVKLMNDNLVEFKKVIKKH
jgi:uncharacterized delta-60 repeat protein